MPLAIKSNPDVKRKKKFSKSDTLEYIISVMKKEFNISPEEDTQFWRKYSSKTYDRLFHLDKTVHNLGLFSDQLLLLEIKNNKV